MTIAGAGACPCGSAPYGYGTPATAPVPGGKVFADAKGIQQSGRKINTATGSYEFDAYGRPVGEPGVRQMVKLALLTIKGSSVLPTLGNELNQILDWSSDAEIRIQDAIAAALKPLVAQKLISILSTTVDKIRASGAFVRVRFKDLTINQIQEETL